MPSYTHEAIVSLFRARATLASTLLETALGIDLPKFERAVLRDTNLSQLVPVEATADLVIVLGRENDERAVFAIVVEVQLSKDPRKLRTWPLYQAVLAAREACEVVVLVVTPHEDVAAWAREPRALGGGVSWWPVVLGPSEVPMAVSPVVQASMPELAVLSAVAHGNDPGGAELAGSVLGNLAKLAQNDQLDHELAARYCDLILVSLNEAARRELQAMVDVGKYEYQSEFAKKHIAEGFEQGIEKGIDRGKTEGLVLVLRARGLTLTPEFEARLASATSAELETWLGRAALAATIDEVFREGDERSQ